MPHEQFVAQIRFVQEFAQQLINGLSVGAIYALIAVGYTMVYGVLRLINFAHGDILMVGAMVVVYLFPTAAVSHQPLTARFLVALAVSGVWAYLLLSGPARRWFSPKPVLRYSEEPDRSGGGGSGRVGVLADQDGGRVHPPYESSEPVLAPGRVGVLAHRDGGSDDENGGRVHPPYINHAHVGGGPDWIRRAAPYLLMALAALVMAVVLCVGQVLLFGQRPSWARFLWAMITSMLACGALGYIIEIVAYRPMRNQPRINALITAIGVSLLLEYGGQNLFGPSPQGFPQLIPGLEHSPDLANIGGVIIPKVDTLIICLTLSMMFVLRHIVMKTRTGMALRAVSFRFDTASLMGIDVNRIVSLTFVIGSMLAAAGGVLEAIRAPVVDPLMGLMIGLKAFIAAVLGGIGNVPGAVAGGFLLGLTEVMVAGYGGSQYRDAVAFVILIAVLLIKPTGLFGSNAIEKV